MKRILSVIVVIAACGEPDAPTPSAAAPGHAALLHASQADLAREIAEADQRGTWRDIQHRWKGQLLRWAVTRRRLLCSSAEDCNVAAFPIERPAKQGWMPVLSFAPGQYDAVAAMCGSREPCDLTVEGTLGELDISPELPTKVQLSNVRIVRGTPGPDRTAGTAQVAHN